MATEKRVAAVAEWTEQVRRIGVHAAQQQETYHAVADALESLRRMHEPSADSGGRTSAPEKEAAFPPAARAPPSSVLAHAAYQPQVSASTRDRGARAPSIVAEEPEASSEREPDARSAHVERMLEEARLLRTTQVTGRLRGAKYEALGSRAPRNPGAVAAGCGKKSQARAQAPNAPLAASAGRQPVTAASGLQSGSTSDGTNVAEGPGKTVDVLVPGESDALERILRQAREIAPLNNVQEATADAMHERRAQRQGMRAKGASGSQALGGRGARGASTDSPALPSAAAAPQVKFGDLASKPLRPSNPQDRKERGPSQSRDEAAKTSTERAEGPQVTQARRASDSLPPARTPTAAHNASPDVQGAAGGERTGEIEAFDVGGEAEVQFGSSTSKANNGSSTSAAAREASEREAWLAFVATLDAGADLGPSFRPSKMRTEVVCLSTCPAMALCFWRCAQGLLAGGNRALALRPLPASEGPMAWLRLVSVGLQCQSVHLDSVFAQRDVSHAKSNQRGRLE